MNTAQMIVQNLEFSGYGPAHAPDDRTIKVQWYDSIHTFKLDPRGWLLDIATPSLGVNPLPSDYTATLAILEYLTSTYKDPPPLDNVIVSKFSNTVVLNSRFGWLVEPEKNNQLVLHTLVVKDKPIWTHPEIVPYNLTKYLGLYRAMYHVFSKVRDNEGARKLAGISTTLLDNMVEWAYTKSGQGG